MTFDLTPFRKVYPFTSRYATIGGHQYHYVDEGQGPPVVLVHGNPTWSFCYRNIIADLRCDHRVIAMDHVGCGLSDKPSRKNYAYTLKQRIDDLEAFLDSVRLSDPVTLVMHDWGGMIAMGWALRHIDRVRRVVVMNTAAFLLPAGKRLPLRLRVIRNGGPIGALLVQGLNGFVRGAVKFGTYAPLPSKARRGYLAPYDSWRHRVANLEFVRDIPLGPNHRSYAVAKWIDDHLHQLRSVPMLILWGRRDFVFDDHFLDQWRQRFPQAEVCAFDDAGHYVMEDKTDETVLRIRKFLTDPGVESPSDRAAGAMA